jgi:hypothetical protein
MVKPQGQPAIVVLAPDTPWQLPFERVAAVLATVVVTETRAPIDTQVKFATVDP